MPSRATLLKLVALACFVAAYRFLAHGVTFKDRFCIGLGCAAITVGVLLLVAARRH